MVGGWSRAPLVPPAFATLAPGAIRARGWLASQLTLQASGLTGRLEDLWDDVGPSSGWRGGDGEAWERGPYYVRGLVALAHALGDAALEARARPWLEWTLASQRDDGFLGPAANDDWWARMPMLEALALHEEATGDPRVLPALLRYFRFQLGALPRRPLDLWAPMRGADNAAAVLRAYERTGEPWLLALVDLLGTQTTDWTAELARDAPTTAFPLGHGVNRAMGLRAPIVRFRRSGDPAALDALHRGWDATMRRHGQPAGVFSCDELLHGRGPTQGAELCAVVELLSALRTVLETTAEPWAAEALERLALNALPAALAPDLCTRQYFQQPNQVLCTPGARGFSVHHGTDLLFGLETGYGCCTANLHAAWPLVVRALWLATADGGLVAPLYAPCTVSARVGGGVAVVIEEDTAWPFDERVVLHVRPAEPARFPLLLRVPAWAAAATIAVDGEAVDAPRAGFARLERIWRPGDVVELVVDARVRLEPEPDGAVHVARGPLVYALAVGEDWRAVRGDPPFADWELHPTTPWARALCEVAPSVERAPVPRQPWTTASTPLRLRATARAVPGWDLADGSAGPMPPATAATGPPEPVLLVPYGAARLRVTCLPRADPRGT